MRCRGEKETGDSAGRSAPLSPTPSFTSFVCWDPSMDVVFTDHRIHFHPRTQQISMCRAAFHTGYVPHGILRLSKSQLDGACLDPRFDQARTHA